MADNNITLASTQESFTRLFAEPIMYKIKILGATVVMSLHLFEYIALKSFHSSLK